MSFKRHHQQIRPLPEPKGQLVKESRNELPDPVKYDPIVEPVKEPEQPVIEPVVKETIKKIHPKKRKKRVDKKEFTNLGLIGDTVVARDFRAIVKKKGDQINTVLSAILHKWNTENYNL